VLFPEVVIDADEGAMRLAKGVIEAAKLNPIEFLRFRRIEVVVGAVNYPRLIGQREQVREVESGGIELRFRNDVSRKRIALIPGAG